MNRQSLLMPLMCLIGLSLLSLAPTAALAAEEGGGSNPFAGTLYQSFATLVVFLALLMVLWKYAWGPILTGLHDREKKIREDLRLAEVARAQAEHDMKQHKAQLEDAQRQAQEIIERARSNAESLAAEIKAKNEADIKTMQQRIERELKAQQQQALEQIYTQVADLATDVASRILQRQISDEDRQRLLEESLQAMQDSQASQN